MEKRFQEISSIMAQCDTLWRFQPFHLSELYEFPWDSSYPQLTPWLNTLLEDDIIRLKSDTSKLINQVSEYIPNILYLQSLSTLNRLKKTGFELLPKGSDSGIPGKKLNQILSMAGVWLKDDDVSEWLEWCSGKGFLGQILASNSKAPVISFEWQQTLCVKGQSLADKKGLAIRFVQGDALKADSSRIMQPNQHAVALHACGDLHVNLIKQGCKVGLKKLSISPCCYHLIESEQYQPLSSEGKRLNLQLSKNDLRIPLQNTVTGGARVRRHRFEEMSFRLGLDSYLKEEKGKSTYTPIPSIKKSMLADGFEAFCCWAAMEKKFELGSIDFEYWKKRGEDRFWKMERISLVQQVFQRPLEIWLILDRALYLQDKGYTVKIDEFCAEKDTPRNILIQAKKRPA